MNKGMHWRIGGIVVFLAIGFALLGPYPYVKNEPERSRALIDSTLGLSQVATTSEVSAADNFVNVVGSNSGTKTLTGTDSVATSEFADYQDAKNSFDYRFQFDNKCNGLAGLPTFGTLNVKQGAAVMLENHGTMEHVLAIGNEAHRVKAGDFIVTYAPKITEPTGLHVTCDGKGAGTLYVYP